MKGYYSVKEQNEFFNNVMKNKVITDIVKSQNEMKFNFSDGSFCYMKHMQDCCEIVTIDDICGDLSDLCNTPILNAELVTNTKDNRKEWDESFTWSFYKFATIKGYVDIKWYGTSNGCYSEMADIYYFDDINDFNKNTWFSSTL